MDPATHRDDMRRLGAAPDYVTGSVQAITENGYAIAVSFGGSQLSSYVHGAGKVIWVVSTNKIVADTDEGLRRVEEHALPLEDQRLFEARGVHSAIGKILIVRREVFPGRVTIVLVKEQLGF